MVSYAKLALVFASLFTAAVTQLSSETSPIHINPVMIGVRSAPGSCPSDGILQSARRNTSAAIQQVLSDITTTPACGGPGWRLAVSLDMSDQSQQCPPPWIESSTPERSCFKGSGDSGGCVGVSFPVAGSAYNHVCGYLTALSERTVDGFHTGLDDINGAYIDGVSVTRGRPREHIWTFATQFGDDCPCSGGVNPPMFVEDNYFCSGQPNQALYSMDCPACCSFATPPPFSATLETQNLEDIEVRICTDQEAGNEAVYISYLELFVF
jgi:hypothetical protein